MSKRQRDNERLTGQLKQCWLESGGVYGYRKLHGDLRDLGEQCGMNRVHRLMRRAGLRAQIAIASQGLAVVSSMLLHQIVWNGNLIH